MLIEALKNWPDWGLQSEPKLIEVFATGQNHHTGLIAVGEQRFVLKVFTHSFERAIAAERLASRLEISAKLLYASNNVALFDYIQCQATPEITLVELARALSKVHDHDASSLGTFNLTDAHDRYLSTANETTIAWHQALLPALTSFINDPTPWCFCHNDLVQENCLVADKLYLIDWEFAQQHNPWFDLAAIIIYFKLNDQDAGDFLNRYKAGWHQQRQNSIFYTSQIALLWTDLLWNMNKFGNDYHDRNPKRFEQLAQLALKLGIKLTS